MDNIYSKQQLERNLKPRNKCVKPINTSEYVIIIIIILPVVIRFNRYKSIKLIKLLRYYRKYCYFCNPRMLAILHNNLQLK